ncbi:hypothetical protein [Haladaptatus halobius]|nr:hypothetical protein [Haladaptatus halobius]
MSTHPAAWPLASTALPAVMSAAETPWVVSHTSFVRPPFPADRRALSPG